MIYEALGFLSSEINKYLNLKISPTTDPRLKIGNVSRALDDSLTGANSLKDKAILSLVNVEEDRIAKQQENYVKNDNKTLYKKPPLYLNLYVVIAINKDDYKDVLVILSHVIQFFQHQNVFTPITHPSLDPRIQKLMVDMYTMNFEQLNHLWSILGGKYMPCVLYKVRQVTIDEEAKTGEAGLIKIIELNERSKSPES